MSDQACLQARQTVDDTSAFTAEQLLGAEQHIRLCSQCEAWRSQVNAIAVAARGMTFFDVPEALTQRIMTDVQAVSVGGTANARIVVLSCVAVIAAVCVLSFDSLDMFDTVNGIIAWSVGFVVLFAFKLLLQSNTRNDARLHQN